MTLEVNKLYKIKHSLYDPWDDETYIIKIIEEARSFGQDLCYPAIVLFNGISGRVVYIYPSDWSIIAELSSLEQELL